MRSKVLTYLFLFIFQSVIAPVNDFHAKIDGILKAAWYLDKKYHQAEFTRFINDLGRRESGNNWMSVNCIGCFGEWQFAESTLHYLGYENVTLRNFMRDPDVFPRELQRSALESLIKVNLAILRKYECYIGDTINGVIITKSGMIAASHLGGAQSLMLFLSSEGRINKTDVLGTSVCDYMKKFNSYDLE